MGNNKIKSNKKTAYFIGIKGVGMTMLAQFLQKTGWQVSGSDNPDVFMTDKVLHDANIKVYSKFAISNVNLDADLIVYSSAYNIKNNIELKFLHSKQNVVVLEKLLSYAQALGKVFNSYKGIAVCGSHGKTTVTAFLGYVLAKCNLEPNVVVGSRVPQFKGSILTGNSKYFVAETDEYQNKLQYFNPYAVLLNNIDYDHPDFFKTEKDYLQVFKDFIKKLKTPGFLVINGSDENILKICKNISTKIISYNVVSDLKEAVKTKTVNYLAYNLKIKGQKQIFEVNNLGEFKISLFGRHNVLNALAVIATCFELGLKNEEIKKALSSFKGTERRCQKLGKYNEALIIDDYAHHPTEVRATLSTIKSVYKKKNIITVFHPHTYTRTKALFKEFVDSFTDTDELIILDIYGSAREKQGGVSSIQLVREINKKNKILGINKKVTNIKTIPEVVSYLRKKLSKDDVLILMGAGDVFRVANKLLKK